MGSLRRALRSAAPRRARSYMAVSAVAGGSSADAKRWHPRGGEGLRRQPVLAVQEPGSDHVGSELAAWGSQAEVLDQSALRFRRSDCEVCGDAVVKIAVFQYDLCLCKRRHSGELVLCQPVPRHP